MSLTKSSLSSFLTGIIFGFGLIFTMRFSRYLYALFIVSTPGEKLQVISSMLFFTFGFLINRIKRGSLIKLTYKIKELIEKKVIEYQPKKIRKHHRNKKPNL